MAFNQDDADGLDAVIKTGVQQVTHADGRSIRYQPTAELLKARDVIATEAAVPIDKVARRRRRVIVGRVGRL